MGPSAVEIWGETCRGRVGAAQAGPTESHGGGSRKPVFGAALQSALPASGARALEGERRWGRRRRGGGGSRAAAPAPVGEERRRRLELLWRRTRGGGRGDPPLSTWTVAKASADAFTPGRGGRTAVAAAAAAERAKGLGAPDGREDLAAPARRRLRPFYGPGRREVCLCARLQPLFLGPAAGESVSGGLGRRWMGSRGPRGTGPGKRRRRRRRSRSPGGA